MEVEVTKLIQLIQTVEALKQVMKQAKTEREEKAFWHGGEDDTQIWRGLCTNQLRFSEACLDELIQQISHIFELNYTAVSADELKFKILERIKASETDTT